MAAAAKSVRRLSQQSVPRLHTATTHQWVHACLTSSGHIGIVLSAVIDPLMLWSPAPCTGLHDPESESLCCGVPQVQAGQPKKKKSKGHMGMKESFTFLAKSPYIRDLATLVSRLSPHPHAWRLPACVCALACHSKPPEGHNPQLPETLRL